MDTDSTSYARLLSGFDAKQNGTNIKFVPMTGKENVMKLGHSIAINTMLNCITGMKEYENKSLEELRFEDYQANVKPGQNFGGIFSFSQQHPFSVFGNDNKTISGFKVGTSLFVKASQQSTGFGQSVGDMAKPAGGVMLPNIGGFQTGLGVQQNETKFVPVSGKENMIRDGQSIAINTRLNCIAGMKEYENKSLEELRFEDYQANVKTGQNFVGSFSSQQQYPFPVFGNENKTISGFTAGTSLYAKAPQQSTGFGQSVGDMAKPVGGVTFPNNGGFQTGLGVQQNGTKTEFVLDSGKGNVKKNGKSVTSDTMLNSITSKKVHENKILEQRFKDNQANSSRTFGDFSTSQSQSQALDFGTVGNQNKTTFGCEAATTPSHGQASQQCPGSGQSVTGFMDLFGGITSLLGDLSGGIFPDNPLKIFRHLCCLEASLDPYASREEGHTVAEKISR